MLVYSIKMLYLIGIFSFIIAMSSFIKKQLLDMCSFKQFIYLEYTLLVIPILIFIFYMSVDHKNIILFKNLSSKFWLLLLCTTLLTIMTPFIYYYLISNYSIIKIVPILEPLIIIFSILLGFFIFNSTITKQELIGISIIIIGIIITTYNKKNKYK